MKLIQPTCLLLWASIAFASALSLEERATCYKGVYMLVARGSEEPQGQGILANVTSMVKSKVPGSFSKAIVYPATLSNYENSESQGVAAAKKAISSYVAACGAKSHVALLGYSQGAQVMADALSGGSFTQSKPLAASVGKYIRSVILMGDPSFIVNKTYDVGTATMDGIFPRDATELAVYKKYGGRTQSYCDNGDPFCDRGNNLTVHLEYVNKYGAAAAMYIEQRA